MPRTDPRFLDHTPEELWLEYLEDMTEKNPEKLAELFKDDQDSAVQYVTSSSAFNEVDALAAKGDFAAVDRMLDSWTKGSPEAAPPEEVFSDDYK